MRGLDPRIHRPCFAKPMDCRVKPGNDAERFHAKERIRMNAIAQLGAPTFGIGADGRVQGYASLFGVVDQARDMVMPGAFRETLKARGLRRIPMLFQHDPSEPVGIWLELREDYRGLYACGRLIPDVQRSREVFALLRDGAIDGLSIGFRTVQGRVDPKTRVRRLAAVDLWEISIVTFPLLAGARVHAVKGSAASSPPRLSPARARAETAWRMACGDAHSPRRHSGAPLSRRARNP
jgi:HK97 family phage prohead protease